MVLGQLLRSTRLIKTLLDSRQRHLQCLCRCASTAVVSADSRIQPRLPVGLLPPATDEKREIIKTSSFGCTEAPLFGSDGRVSSPSIASKPLPAFLLLPLSSRVVTECVLPTSNFIFGGRGAIYTVPLGYRRARHLEETIGDAPVAGPSVVKRDPAAVIIENSIVQEPPPPAHGGGGVVQEKQAARLITIRRKKMKKHKLRKLRKKMHFVWAKVRQRREARKRKVFENELLSRMAMSDDFDADAWVREFLRKATTDPATLVKKIPPPPRPTRYVLD